MYKTDGLITHRIKVFGIKAMTVVVTASMVLSSVPTTAIAEELQEVGLIAVEEQQSDQSGSVEQNETTTTEGTTDNTQSTDQSNSQDNSVNTQESSQPAQDAATDASTTEATISLELNNAYITYGNAQTVQLPATSLTVSTSSDFTFSATPDNGYNLNKVVVTINGTAAELTADTNGVYTIAVADLAKAPKITLETEKQEDAKEAAPATNIEVANLNDDDIDTQDDESAIAPVAIDGDWSVSGNDTLEVGKFAVYIANDFSGSVTWSTSDSSIATVDANGVVTAVAEGTVDVIATCGTEVAKKEIEVTKASSASGYKAVVTPTIENADVAYFAWHDSSDVSNIAFGKVSGTVTVNDYTTWNKPGYIVFFVKPDSNHIVTGLGASGNGDIYAVDATSWGNINGYPSIAKVMAAAKSAGYVAAFGWSRSSTQTLSADFTIKAQSPDMTVTATSDRTKDVAAGDELTFTVTITPKTTGSGKDSVTGVHVNSANVNGTTVEVENLTQNSDGSFTGTVHYTATNADCNRGSVVLTVNATSTYSGAYTISSGDISSSATITKTATCTCQIAPASQVQYVFKSGTSDLTLPGVINSYLPSDNDKYIAGMTVSPIAPEVTEYEDAENDGYWTFAGWDKNSATVSRKGGSITFTGTWSFTKYSKYTVKYVDEDGNEIAKSSTVSGNKVGDEIEKSAVAYPEIQGYTYSETSPSAITISKDDSKNVFTVTYKKKAGKAGYNLVLNSASWTAPEKTTNTEKMKWYFDYGFAKGDTFTVTNSEPTAADHVFIGWMDKERDGQAAAIRKAGDTVTYCYSKNQTYTLDALWASLSAMGEDVTYDGKSHTVTVDVKINDGTGLDDKYVEQAKKLIATGDVQYSTDGGTTWSTEKPTFKDAGTYSVQVKQDITVGGVTTTLTAEAEVKIAQKEYYVKTNTDSKRYDGTTLKGTAEVIGIVEGESATAEGYEIGPDVTVKTYNTVHNFKWGEGTNPNNYTHGKDKLGALEITKQKASAYTATVSIKGWEYNGVFDLNHTLTSENNAGNGQATYSYYKKNGENWDKLSAEPVDVGEYKVVANWAADRNYPALEAETTFNITKRTITVQARFYTYYTGKKQTVTIDVNNIEHGGVYGLLGTETFKLEGATLSGTKAGTYTTVSDYTWSVERNSVDKTENYTVKMEACLDIQKKTDLKLEATGYSGTYDGKSHAGVVTVSDTEDTTIEYSVDGGKTWSADAPSITDVVRDANGGVSKLDVTVRAYNANYTNKDAKHALTATYSLEVKPLPITVSAEDTNIYSGDQQELTITADKAEGVLDGETLALENAKVLGTDVAEYTTVASGYTWSVVKADGTTDSTNNYNIAVSGKLTITPAPLTVTTGSTEKVFDGAALTKNEASLEGLVGRDADVATVKATGSQTEVGKTSNTYEITWGAVNKKNYTLTEKLGELEVTAQPIETGTDIDSPRDYKYDGDAHKWEPTVTSKDGKTTLVKDADYTVSYSTDDFTNVTGEITVTITGTGNYTGTVMRTYQVTQRAVTLTSGSNSWTYDGAAHSQKTVKVSGDGFAKQEGVSYSDFASVTEPTDKAVDNTFTYAAQTGTNLNNYKVTVENGELAITQQSINPDDKDYAGIKVGTLEDVYYNGKVQEQKPTVTNKDGIALTEGTDYEVSFSEDTTNAGTVTVTIAGKGNYTGTVTRTYKIKPIAITVTDTATLPYNGSDQTLTISSDKASGLITGEKLTLDGATITGKEIGEYTEVSKYNWSVSKADDSDSTGNYTISVTGKLTITQQSINPDDDGYVGVQVGTLADVVYNGASQKQKPTVTDKKGTALVEGTDYELSYSKDTTNVGEVAVTVTGIGKYTGTVKRTYNITQRSVTFTGETNTKYYSGSKQSIDKITVSETVKNSGLVEGQTWSGLTYRAEGTEPGTYDGSFSGTLSIKSGDQDVTANYAVTKTPGKLTISKSEIAQYVTLTGTPAEKVYDGTALVAGTATATDTNGHAVTIEYQKSDGTWTTDSAEVTAINVSDTRTVNVRASVPDYYDGYVTTTETLTVTKRAITVEDSKTVDYNGQNQTLTIDGAKAKNLATGETLTLTGATVTGKNAGTYTKVADGYTWNVAKSDSSDSTGNYSIAVAGTLTIKKLSAATGITITPNNVTEKYDGDSHYAGKASATASVEGTKVTLEYRVKGSTDDEWRTYDAKTFAAVNAGMLTLEIRAYADNYDGYATAEETLTINRRVVEIHTLDASKTYDGTELTTKNDHTSYYIAKDGFIGTDVVDIYCTGTITDAGSTPNTIYYKLKDGAAKNYDIKDSVLGTLTVNPRSATITAGTATKSYDGEALTTAEFKTEGFVGDQGVASATVNGSQLYVGSSKSSIDQSTVVAKAGTKLTNYAITYKTGTLTVTDKDTDADKVITKTHAADTCALGKTIIFTITAKNIYATAKTMTISEQNGVSFVAQDGMTIEDGKAVFENVQPGGVVTLQATHRVTEADILAGTSYKNTATVAFSDEGKTFNGEDTATVDKAVSNLKVEKVATSSPANKKSYVLNETIIYTITVTNTGNLTVKDIKVSDPKADGFGNKTVDELAPGEFVIFAAEHKVTESDIQAGEVVNVATATGTDSKKEETKGEDTDTEPTDTPNAHLQVTKTAEQNGSAVDGAFKLGETISYAITVKNTGNQTVKNVMVSDPNADNFGEQTIGSLAPGESETFEATHKVTQEDILAGSVVNTATAKGSQPDGKEIENEGSDTKTVDDLDTMLTVTKTASAPADGVSYKLGEKVAYTITVTNNGNVDYKNVVVTDAAAGFTSEKFDLAVGETKTFNTGIEHVITEDDIVSGSFTNTAKAEADPITDPKTKQDVTPSGEAFETIGGDSTDKKIDEGNANLTITKTVTNEGKGTGEDGTFALGDTIEYAITVTNNGNLTAKNFTVVDENADNFQPVTITELAPGATTEAIAAAHVVTSADILAGKVVNVATTTGGSTDDPDVKPTPDPDKKDNGKAESEVDDLDTTLVVIKTASAPADGVSYKLGEKVAYTITVTNNGNVDYKNVVVTDAAAGFTSEKFDLAVGETKTFNTGIEHVITEDDIVSGSFTNTAKAEADPITDPKTKQDVTPSGEDSETIGGDSTDKKIDDAQPKLVLTKTSDVVEGTLLKEGDVVNYTVVVSNTGNLTLSNVKVTDKLAGAVLAEGESETIDSLEPGESATLHYSYTVTQADVVNGSVTNEVTGTAENPSKEKTDVTPGTQTDPTEKSAPSLFVSKTADKTANVKAGDTITYTITVTNNGNVDLTGVVVTDELVGFTSEAFDLAKGKTETFIKTYTVTEDDLVAGKVENVASATAKGPKDETVDGTSDKVVTETEPVAYGLKVEKTAAKGSYAAGDTITYTIKVTNTGNTTVSGITVADNKTGFSKSDVTLAPGKSEEFTTDYTVTAGDITAGKLENTATADGTDVAGNKPHGEDTNTVDNKKQVDPDNPDEPTLKREFTVEDLSNVTYNGKAQELKPVVTDVDGTVLVEGIDYELSYTGDTTNVTDTGVTVTVTGKGNYTGSVDKTYQIAPATITVVTPDAFKVYDGSALTAKGSIEGLVNDETVGFETTGSVTAVDDENNGVAGNNTYTIEWANAGFFGIGGNAYTAKQSNYTVKETLGTLTVTPQSIVPDPDNPDSYKGVEVGNPEDVTYDGSEHQWVPVVKDAGGNVLTEGKDYTVTYDTADFTNVTGVITVTIQGIGSYTGTIIKTYSIKPAALHIATGSATATYNGQTLTSSEIRVDGLVAGDVIGVTATGSQTAVGSSSNTYTLNWMQVNPDNYALTDELGTLTVIAAPVVPDSDNGGTTPVTPSTNDNGATTPVAPSNGNVIDTIARTMEDTYNAVTGNDQEEAADEEKIFDSENPLGRSKHKDQCWVHWYMILVAVLTAVYGLFVGLRRNKHTHRLEDDLNGILGAGQAQN